MQPSAPERQIEALIVVKAAPTPSKKTGESVCVAAVEIAPVPTFLRFFPIDFRGLPHEQRFRKGDVIRCVARRPRQDTRPESWCPNIDTLEVVDRLERWQDRWPLIEPLVIDSMCELQRRERTDGTSLGLFRPREVLDFREKPCATDWDEGRAAAMNQVSLLPTRRKRPLEKIPFTFSYEYLCNEPGCRGHTQQLIDWELAELYRKTRGHPTDERLRLVRERWLDEVCSADRETYFYAGNMNAHPHAFILLGAFWPRASALRKLNVHEQLALV